MKLSLQSTVRSFRNATALVVSLPAMALGVCAGDCDANGKVTIDEVVHAVGVAVDGMPLEGCFPADMDRNETVSVNELVAAVSGALNGCRVVQPFAAIQTVFSQSCAFSSCHSALSREGDLVLSDEELSWDNLLRVPDNQEAADMGLWRVLPGDPERSYLIKKLRGDPDITGSQMPLDNPGSLTREQMEGLVGWVRAGALNN